MHAIVALLGSVLRILGIWTAASLAACAPLALWFRAQARRNERRTREGRRRAFADAAGRTVAR